MSNRFERTTTPALGSKLFSRREVNPRLALRDAAEPASFLARLWALFGPAEPSDGGFTYSLRDRETGLVFSAYSGASGPSYGGAHQQLGALKPVVEALEQLLDATTPADCELTFTADIEYGGAEVAIGWRNGKPFAESRDRRTAPASAQSFEECVAIAHEHEGGYGALAGWQACLDAVLPEPPDDPGEPVGFTLDDNDVPSMLYVIDDGSPEPIPIAEIAFDPPLSGVAKRWLDAYERWRSQQ